MNAKAIIAAIVASSLMLATSGAMAAVYYWDADADTTTATGGSGTWDLSSTLWRASAADGSLTAWPNTSTDEVVFAGAAATVTLNSDSVNMTAGKLTFGVSGYTLSAASAGAATIALAAPTTVEVTTSGQTATISALLTGTGSLAKTGAGTLALTGQNTYSGGTTLSSGTLSLSGAGTSTAGALGTGSLNVTGNSTLTSSSAATIYNAITVNSGVTFSLSSATASISLLGNISGSGTISESGANTGGTHLAGDNSGFTGTFTSSNKTNHRVRFDSASAGSASASWDLNNSQTDGNGLNFGNGTISFGSLSGTGVFRSDAADNTTSIISVGALNTNSEWKGQIVANNKKYIALTKVGTGTFTISGTNTYTGATTISNGTMLLANANAISGTLSINIAGGILASNLSSVNLGGTTCDVVMTAGGISANQSSVGTLIIAAGRNFSATGGTIYETINGLTCDSIGSTAAGSGTFSLSNVTIDLTGSTNIDYSNYYTMFGNFAGGTLNNINIIGYDTSLWTAQLDASGVLSFAAVATPEPSTLCLVSLMGALLLTRSHRRQ